MAAPFLRGPWGYYEPDHAGITAMARDPQMTTGMVNIATEVGLPFAKSIAPKKTGTYANSIRVKPGAVQAGYPNHREFRGGAMIIADVEYATEVEYIKNKGQGPLGATARMLQREYGSKRAQGRKGAM